jgi:uncharacterized surface protein with fasciclin (FAS1) repeats
MKKSHIACLAGLAGMLPLSALANNVAVESALKNRPDLSTFYQALTSTGVLNELDANTTYTVFAPTNNAFERIMPEQYPCFFAAPCAPQLANVLRNHIVAGTTYMDDTVKQHGGLYSINNRFVPIGEPSRGTYTVEGSAVVYTQWFAGGILYKINGIIASPREMAAFSMTPVAADKVTTSNTATRIPDPSCGPQGCPDTATQTTTVTHSVVAPVPVR